MEKVIEIISQELETLKNRIIDNIYRTKRNASGKTINSLRVEASGNEGILFGRKYFGTLETGRGPGKIPKDFQSIIAQWAVDKGLFSPDDYKLKTFSYFVSKKISDKGTKLFRNGGDNEVYSQEIPKTIENIGDRTMNIITTMYDSIKLNEK
ncbi:hypothetical protein [Coprobacter secundus]|uniref:hypothetical protein n=1 Tax=Coprobacter secundus TaxID=1501392 RepID=UPI0023F6B110|nr:hypothetical protein [Coprobacter secundus]